MAGSSVEVVAVDTSSDKGSPGVLGSDCGKAEGAGVGDTSRCYRASSIELEDSNDGKSSRSWSSRSPTGVSE